MSRRIRFEGNDQQKPDAANDSAKKKRKQQRQQYRDLQTETSAAPNDSVGAAFAPLSGSSAVNGGINPNIAGLQHGTANAIRNTMPDETPDRNVAVSATRFFMELEATASDKMTIEPKSKTKRKSKLKTEDSRLKFEQGETKSESGGSSEVRSQSQNVDDAENPVADVENKDSETDVDSTNSDDVPSQEDSADSDPSDTKPKPKQPKPDGDTAAETNGADSPVSASDNPDGRLLFTKDESKVAKLEKKADKYAKKLDKAEGKLPTKKVKKKQLVFDEEKGKTVSKLTHEKEKIPIGEAKWNTPKSTPMPLKAVGVATSMTVTKVHAKIHQVEHENVGVKVAHKTELLAESGYRGSKRTVKSAYRYHKNRPYRRVAKLEQKSIKNKMKLDYRKALRDNPKLKSNPLSRFMQKRAIKRNYAKDLRNAKNAAVTTKKAVGITARAGKIVTAIIRKNPVFLIKAGILLLIVFLILSMLTMCMAMFSGGTSFVGAVSYAAEYEDICDASVLYTELETDLRVYIFDIETNHPGYDEYRLSIDSIGHDPFALMAFLTAVYHDFTFAEVEATIRAIFDAQYTLELVSEMEIRTRVETRTGTGSWTDAEGNTHTYTYTYTVIVEYEWHILNVNLTSRPFTDVLMEMMDEDQTQHFYVLMQSKGARQFVGNPFDFDWRPFVTSLYGYRIHPISGGKQFHWGLDIGLPQGTPLLAALDGVVVAVGYQPTGYGNFVVIECADGNQVRYAHCHEVFVTQGQTVERGDVIATVGTTGASTGPHLHIEVSRDGRRLNPIFFLDFR